MKVFRFEERIPATLVQVYEVTAETEEEALTMVLNGYGFQEAFTDNLGPGEFEMYDSDDIP